MSRRSPEAVHGLLIHLSHVIVDSPPTLTFSSFLASPVRNFLDNRSRFEKSLVQALSFACIIIDESTVMDHCHGLPVPELPDDLVSRVGEHILNYAHILLCGLGALREPDTFRQRYPHLSGPELYINRDAVQYPIPPQPVPADDGVAVAIFLCDDVQNDLGEQLSGSLYVHG